MALQVIGAGLGRTGTLSLKLALEHLGFGPCYHMTEVLASARKTLPLWNEVVRGRPDWDAVFEGFASTVDYPGCSYWRELAAHYPAAKVILSTRDAAGWFSSVSSTIFAPDHLKAFNEGPLAEFMTGAVTGVFGDSIGDRDFMEDHFARWQEAVTAALPPQRLLVFSAQEGWGSLCAFLGVPVPAEPYPRVNSREDMQSSGRPSEPPPPEAMEAFARSYIDQQQAKAFGPRVG